MEDPQSSLNSAFEHYENGQIKDAYNAFLATAHNAMKPLFDVKFVHCSIVSKPQNSAALLSMLHSCIDHIEKIMEYHSPTASSTSKIAPPLPPKPSHVSKPVLPPKPSTTTTRATPPIPPSANNAMMMKRTLSAKDNHTKQAPSPSPQQQHTQSNSYQLDSSYQDNNEPVPDGEINACHLVPAQTNNSDSLTPPNSSSSIGGIKSDHIPLIPIPPLLTTHTVLQEKLDELELALKDFRAQKNQLSGDSRYDKEQEMKLNDAIAKYTPYVAEAKHTLNRVRTLYMCAATIPSILHFQPGLVAYQLTRIESAIFLAIPPQALLSHAPKTPHPRVVASSDFFNYVTRMIEHSVLLPQEASVRAQHINQWIKVASKCQDLNNYQTLKGIISALWTPPVQRLKRTWAYIPKKSLSRLESMTELMSEANNYGKYREHMGIVSTSVLNGKSVNLIQSEHYKRPTVPFLGTFIHDMTYLLAAVGQAQQQQQQQQTKSMHPGLPQIPIRTSSRLCKVDSNSSSAQLHKDPRISKLLEILQKFQSSPPYDRKPSAANAKMITKQQVRPALSQAIHRSKSSFGRLGGAIGFGNGNTDSNSTSDLISHQNGIYNTDCADDFDAEEQQSLVTQYLLMRPWVSQNTVDELSLLREPPSNNSTSSSNNNKYVSGRTSSMGSHYTSSIMSNTSSLMRLSNPATNSTLTLASSLNDSYYSRPASLDDAYYYHQSRSYVYGRESSNVGPLTSSSTLEDNDDGEFDEENGATSHHHHVAISPRDGKFWNDPTIALYNKESSIVAPTVPPRPSPLPRLN